MDRFGLKNSYPLDCLDVWHEYALLRRVPNHQMLVGRFESLTWIVAIIPVYLSVVHSLLFWVGDLFLVRTLCR